MRLFSKSLSLLLLTIVCSHALLGQAQPNLRNNSFYNWESAHVHPLDLTPDGTKLLAVNTANNSLEVYNVAGTQKPALLKSIPVGLDPVSVRARTNSEAWVVNVISDSVSIVNLTAGAVVNTLQTDDEPADVVFAGTGTKHAFVSCAQAKTLLIFDPASPSSAPSRIPIMGEQPRALAVSPDGRFVYLAIFESGNQTTAVTGGKSDAPFEVDIVRDPRGPYGGVNVPPNSGNSFVPPINPALPAPPPVSMIVKKTLVGGLYKWLDDNAGDWTQFVSGSLANNGSLGARVTGWDLPDRDVAIVDTANSNALSYQNHLMNIVMSIAVNPATGEATVVGTDSTNQTRYEPNLQSTFVRVNFARFVAGGANSIADLNPHLTYNIKSIPLAQRQLSIGDPRGSAWNAAGTAAYVTGMGSNNVVVIGKTGARQGLINVGQGPTGIVLQEAATRAFVLNKFDASISTINLSSLTETSRTPLYLDPTPASVKAGRPFLYNTHINSGLGQASCASCHVDARWDRLAWDLGDPTGSMVVNSQNIPFHPMKGPLLTMSLMDTMQAPFLHWRGDRPTLENFEGSFQTLLGADQPASESTIQALRAFLSTTALPPNPYRNLDNSYSTNVQIPGPNNTIGRVGDANAGAAEFEGNCRSCHPGQTNRGNVFVTNGFGLDQFRNPPTWKNFYKRFGLWFSDANASTAGFGFQQDGTFDSTHNGSRSNNMMAFMLSFNGGYPYEPAGLNSTNVSNFTHAAIGKQVTISQANPTDTTNLLSQLQTLADQGAIGLVAKGMINGHARGYAYLGKQVFQSDSLAEQNSMTQLLAAASANSSASLTFTAVPTEGLMRIGVDMDLDGILDYDDPNPTLPNFVQSNLALNGTASQSSTWDSQHSAAQAIDGNTLGYFDQNSLAHTAGTETSPWWQVDLGNTYQLNLVQLFNRQDCCATRLSDVSVFVSMTPFASGSVAATRSQPGVVEFFLPGYAGMLPQIPMNLLGRYVRVQLNSSTLPSYLQLAEVRVMGAPVTEFINPGDLTTGIGVPVSLPTFVNSNSGTYTVSAAGLPLGLSINPSTGVITGTIQPNSPRSNAVTITAAGPSNYTLSFNWFVSGGTNVLSLAGSANVWGVATPGTPIQNGGLDGAGFAYASNLLGSSITYNGVSISLSAANAADAVSSVTIPVTPDNYTSLNLLGAAIFGNQINQVFTVNYTDGTSSAFQQSLSDWMSPQNYAGETVASSMAYRLSALGGVSAGTTSLYGYSFVLNPAKVVSSVTLPFNRHVVILGMALTAGSTTQPDTTICQATKAAGSFCSDQTPGPVDGSGFNSLPSWTNLQKSLASITVSDNHVWGLDSAGSLWYLPNFKSSVNWIKTGSGVKQISAGHNLLCQINLNTHVYCSTSINFQTGVVSWYDAGATNYRQIAVSAGTKMWAIDANNNLFQISDYTHMAGTAVPVAGGVQQVAADGKGLVCGTDLTNALSCSGWPVVPATPDNSGYYHSLTNLVKTGASLQNIGLADGKVWGTDSAGIVWLLPDYTNSATWQKIASGGVGDQLATASVPSQFVASTFASDEVAVLLFMGQSNSSGINLLPSRFIAPSSPNVWGVTNGGWNYLPGNGNGTTPFTNSISSISSIQWSNWSVSSSGADMNLGFNTGANANAANFAAFQWQAMIDAGAKLPDLYIVHVAWPSEGVDPQDNVGPSTISWLVHGVNLWQPALGNTQQPSYALAPFARRIVYNAMSKILAAGKKPRIIALQWNQWEAEAGNPNAVSVTDAPANYSSLFSGFNTAVGSHIPVQLVKPLSTAYGPTKLSQMQAVFANLVNSDQTDFSQIDVSQFSSNVFGGGVLGGGDGSVHYGLDTQRWFANQAVGACLVQANCGLRVTSVPSTPTN